MFCLWCFNVYTCIYMAKTKVVFKFKEPIYAGMSDSDMTKCISLTTKCLNPSMMKYFLPGQIHTLSTIWGSVTGHTEVGVTVTPVISYGSSCIFIFRHQ
jgi:3,4-dihydroxy-2-butanone 4-phosphate synthase